MSEQEIPFPQAVSPEVREFLVAAHAYANSRTPKISPATVSSIIFNHGRQIHRLESGCDLTTGRLRAAWERLRALQNGGPRTRIPRKQKGAEYGGESRQQEERDQEADGEGCAIEPRVRRRA
jgi:hypothetical protein